MSSYYIGFLVGCGIAPRLLRQKGHVRVFVALSLLSAVVAIAYPTYAAPAMWALFRFVTGAATAGIYVTSESWLAGAGHPKTRGRLLAVYLLVVNAGYGLGQLLLGTGSPESFVLFGVAAGLIAVAALPLLRRRRVPENQPSRLGLRVDRHSAARRCPSSSPDRSWRILGLALLWPGSGCRSAGRAPDGKPQAGLVLQGPIGALSIASIVGT